MREIKFRAWDKEDMVMDYSMSFAGNISENMNDKPGIGEGERFSELMQYTGLKDKNGKEIYEGDIMATRVNTSGVVVFYMGAWRVRRGNYKPTPVSAYTWREVYEVIGNIYETPELIKHGNNL